MKVVITGGTGFIGLILARRLLEKGELVNASGRAEAIDAMILFDQATPQSRPEGLDDRVSIVVGDISDRDTVFGLVDRDDIAVFHLASVVSSGGEKDFDLAMRVNLDGGLNVLEAVRDRNGLAKLLFTSSIAIFGGDAMPDVVGDATKPNPQTTYGMTKFVGEMMINDYSRKGFLDGRTARLPTVIIRPGKPNAAASSFASGVLREPLNGEDCVLPVSRDTAMASLGYRNIVEGIIQLMEMDAAELGADRAVGLPSQTYTVTEMITAMEGVAQARGIKLGEIIDRPDPAIEAIVAGWPTATDNQRALSLGLPLDSGLAEIIENFVDDYIVA